MTYLYIVKTTFLSILFKIVAYEDANLFSLMKSLNCAHKEQQLLACGWGTGILSWVASFRPGPGPIPASGSRV